MVIFYLHTDVHNLVRGDVIVFTNPSNMGFIVHRIVSSSTEGMITRGDHNRLSDSSPITMDQIIGKVELAENKHGTKSISDGLLGLWKARIWHIVFWLDRLARRVFWVPYQLVHSSRLVSLIWHPRILKLLVQIGDGSQVKFIYKQCTVATYDPYNQRFDCCKPFDLVISRPEDQ
jgi:hypothetical protein